MISGSLTKELSLETRRFITEAVRPIKRSKKANKLLSLIQEQSSRAVGI